ncbi:type VII toxin-antitoxin system HepT family RNase toxin [Calderihabitans maritimus]|uniref:DUF86 domain-containing protein n=1 Tax=Calderihabitans maritimus TaxID=1246530 RepID=A0A1Z5HP32_9FIRM|nr:DUF86 domain-containing protein [Calderihabitans maritimus]GAW91292.1 hypothetical protein Asulf_00542 [Calderihabitans maritimus]
MKYRQLNLARIREKVTDIKESLAFLRQYAMQNDETFLKNKEAVHAARYSFIVLIEAAMNIANHFCARLLDKAPETYAETFLLLGEEGIIDPQLAQRLAQMAKFRNLLVHGYGKVDDRRMLRSMREDLSDVEAFIREITKIVMEAEEKNNG